MERSDHLHEKEHIFYPGLLGYIHKLWVAIKKLCDTVNVRLLVIIFFSAVPIATIAIIFAWNNYRLTFSSSLYRGVVVASQLNAAIQAQIADTRTVMHALARQHLQNDPAACSRVLNFIRSASDHKYRTLQFKGSAGEIVCSSGDLSMLQNVQVHWEHKSPVLLIPFSPDKGPDSQSFFIQITRRIYSSEKFSTLGDGYLTGVISVGGSRKHFEELLHWGKASEEGETAQAWVIYNEHQVVPLCKECSWAKEQPPTSRMIARLRGEHAFYLHAFNKTGIAYSLMQVAPGIDLVVQTARSDQEQHAFAFFIVRIIEIIFFLFVGLGAVSVGANVLVTAPLKRLGHLVEQWKKEKKFETTGMRTMPLELRQLGFSFAKATRKLARHEANLEEAERNQKLLIREIHHRVKNNLQIIASMLNLQANRITHPESKVEFAAARERVKALATLHRYLYGEDSSVQAVEMRQFMEELCWQILSAFHYDADNKIILHTEIEDVTMTIDQAVPVALVVTEILSNALKYAFPNDRKGKIEVSFRNCPPRRIELEIKDNGVGFDSSSTPSGGKGIGMQLIRGFARQIGAKMDIISNKGTCYKLSIPYIAGERKLRENEEEDGLKSARSTENTE